MFLVTAEDDQGMWWDDPIAATSAEEARKLALAKWGSVPEGIALVLWYCHDKGEIERAAIAPTAAPDPHMRTEE